MSIFGPLITGEAVESALQASLERWLPTYLAELERRTGRTLPLPASYQVVSDLEEFIEQGAPMVVLVARGLDGQPVGQGDAHSAAWIVNAVVVVPAESRAIARQLAGLYAAAIRWVCAQQGSLDGFAVGTDWRDEEYIALETGDRRMVSAARVELRVEVADVLDAHAGPIAPATSPHPDWPEVESIEVDITKEPIPS